MDIEVEKSGLDGEKPTLIESLQQLSNKILEYKNLVIKQTDSILRIIELWITDDNDQCSLSPINLISELQQLYSSFFQQKQENQSIINIHKAHLEKLLNSFNQLLMKDQLFACCQNIQAIEQIINSQANKQKGEEVKQNNEQSQTIEGDLQNFVLVPKKVTEIYKMKQSEKCFSIVFNNSGTLLVAGCAHEIKVWKFDKGVFMELERLTGHTKWVTCLVFSKKINWFASGSHDSTIRGWKDQVNIWAKTQPQKQHSDDINCLILNSQENELISCSDDQTIKVWNVDQQSNQIQFNYTLENKHTNIVCCVSLNTSETALVSCSMDDTIILWMKGQNQKWEYINHIEVSYGKRICFISDTQILFQPNSTSQTLIFQIENKQLVEQSNLKIDLKEADDDMALFPTIYNKKKQVIIQKHNQYVYIIQRQIDSSFKIVLQPIDCSDKYNYGSLTDDGEYLVIYSEQDKEFIVYQIFY